MAGVDLRLGASVAGDASGPSFNEEGAQILVGSKHGGPDLTWAGILLAPVPDGFDVAVPPSAQEVWGGISVGEVPDVLGHSIVEVVVCEVPLEAVRPYFAAGSDDGDLATFRSDPSHHAFGVDMTGDVTWPVVGDIFDSLEALSVPRGVRAQPEGVPPPYLRAEDFHSGAEGGGSVGEAHARCRLPRPWALALARFVVPHEGPSDAPSHVRRGWRFQEGVAARIRAVEAQGLLHSTRSYCSR